MDIDALKQELSRYGQEHLVQFWDALNESERDQLYNEIVRMNLENVTRSFRNCMDDLKHAQETLDDQLEPLPESVVGSVARTDPDTLKQYEIEGLRQIANGKVAVLLLAGGQGTRLGVSYPKGMYDVGLPSRKTLYHLQAQRILKIQQLAQQLTGKTGIVPWYIMTSEATKESTEMFFHKHSYFGMASENVVFFEQSTLPCMTFDGKIILESRSAIAKAPDGNGGLYSALGKSKVLDDIIHRGVEYLHVYCVDNILVKMADPVFIGFCIARGACCGVKVVEKTVSTEPVGVVCRLNGKYHVAEYSEITIKTAEKRDSTGKLAFRAGGIANHFFTVDFMKTLVSEKEAELQHHVAQKKIPYCSEHGQLVKPTQNNGIKMEKFVFDIFRFADNFAVWEVIRQDEFSPLKNADGSPKDTPTTSRHDLMDLHRRWVLRAGGHFIQQDGSPLSDIPSNMKQSICENNNYSEKQDCEVSVISCEISPLVSYDGEGLEDRVSGMKLKLPFVILSDHETIPSSL